MIIKLLKTDKNHGDDLDNDDSHAACMCAEVDLVKTINQQPQYSWSIISFNSPSQFFDCHKPRLMINWWWCLIAHSARMYLYDMMVVLLKGLNPGENVTFTQFFTCSWCYWGCSMVNNDGEILMLPLQDATMLPAAFPMISVAVEITTLPPLVDKTRPIPRKRRHSWYRHCQFPRLLRLFVAIVLN